MSGGTFIVQLLGIIFYPIITRIYLPSELGIFTLYVSTLGIVLIIATFKYEFSIPIPKSDVAAFNALLLAVFALTIFSLFFLTLLFFYGNEMLVFLDAESLAEYKYLIPIGVFFTGCYGILTQWAIRKKEFKKITKTKFSQGIGLNVSQMGLGLLKFGPFGLIVGHIVGNSAGIVTLISNFFKSDRYLIHLASIRRIKWASKRFIRFPLFATPSQLFNKGALELPVFFITALYGSAEVGLYGLAHVIVSLPVTLIGTAISDVFFAEAAKIGKTEPSKLQKLSNKLFKQLLIIGVIPASILLFFGPQLFAIVFGEKWYEAGEYAQILSVLALARLVFTPITKIYFAFEKHIESFVLNIFRFFTVLGVFFMVQYYGLAPHTAVWMYVISLSLVYLITYIHAKIIISNQVKSVDKKVIK